MLPGAASRKDEFVALYYCNEVVVAVEQRLPARSTLDKSVCAAALTP